MRFRLVRFLQLQSRVNDELLQGGAAMPLYSYHCARCEQDVELLVSSSETPICPDCGGRKLQRLVSRTAPEAKSRGLIKSARAQAAREGHLSNYSRAERRR
jgi:putative FmdB family regulatory protein